MLMQSFEFIILGNQWLEKKKPEEALVQYITAIQQGENDANAFYCLGCAYEAEALDKKAQAYLAFKETILLSSSHSTYSREDVTGILQNFQQHYQEDHAYLELEKAMKIFCVGYSEETREKFARALQRNCKQWQEAEKLTIDDLLILPQTEVIIEHGFRLDTYQFEKLSLAAQEAVRHCHGIRCYFDASKYALEEGNVNLAVEILEIAVNEGVSFTAKGNALYLAARILQEIGEYERALRYQKWAEQLKPEDEDIKKLKSRLIARTWQGS